MSTYIPFPFYLDFSPLSISGPVSGPLVFFSAGSASQPRTPQNNLLFFSWTLQAPAQLISVFNKPLSKKILCILPFPPFEKHAPIIYCPQMCSPGMSLILCLTSGSVHQVVIITLYLPRRWAKNNPVWVVFKPVFFRVYSCTCSWYLRMISQGISVTWSYVYRPIFRR